MPSSPSHPIQRISNESTRDPAVPGIARDLLAVTPGANPVNYLRLQGEPILGETDPDDPASPRVPDLLPPCAADQIQRSWLLGFITAWLETLPEAEPVENGLPLYAMLGGTLWRNRPLLLELLPIALELMEDPSH